MTRPTRDDAHLMLELANWYTASEVAEAANWIRSEEFVSTHKNFESQYPDGSQGRLHVNKFLGYHETLGTLWKNGLISEELLFDWTWVSGAWDLVKDIAVGMRKKAGVAALWENFEAMAERQRTIALRPAKAVSKKRTTQKRAARSRTVPAGKRTRS
jgi:hypothetical protein